MKINKPFILFLTLLSGCDHPQPIQPPPRPALVMVVGNRLSPETMSLAGEVRPRFESGQGFRIAGKIVARKADVGDIVKKGQIIAKLDPTDTNLNVSSAQADVQSAETNRDLALAELARYQKLSLRHFVSASMLDIKKAELKTAEARLAQAKANAEIALNQTTYTDLRADRNGVVSMIHAEPGQVVKAGEVIATIADTSSLEVLVAVPESKMDQIRSNNPVKLKLWAHPERIYSGKIREISPAADPATRAFNVSVAIDRPDAAVKLGMTARVRFAPENTPETGALLIPNSALTKIGDKPSVWVIDAANKAQPRDVTAGAYTEDGILISDGLQAGERIAIAGVHTLLKDQLVTPVVEALP